MQNQSEILYMIASAFFSGFAVGLNKKSNKRGVTFLQFVSDILIHGVSGSIIGALATLWIKDAVVICAIAAIGGMFGQQLIRIIANRFIKKYLPNKKDIDDNDKDIL